MKPGKHQRSEQRCKDAKMHNLLFCVHTICMNYVTNTFLLVSSSARSKQLLCFVHRQGQKREQKHTTKNFLEFHNHSPQLTMHLRKKSISAMAPKLCIFEEFSVNQNSQKKVWRSIGNLFSSKRVSLVQSDAQLQETCYYM